MKVNTFVTKLDGKTFFHLISSGLNNLQLSEEAINDLNVFPVPDGDTGTNMRLTLLNGVENIDEDMESLSVVLSNLSRGMLLGARGNSGVILSQIFKGVSVAIKDDSVDALKFVDALVSGYKLAYEAVNKPVEGTILTVVREGVENIKNKVNSSTRIDDFIMMYYQSLKKALKGTTSKLKELKDADVVDSGGAGYLAIIEGMVKYLNNEKVVGLKIEKKANFKENFIKNEEYKYCTEFILKLNNENDFVMEHLVAYLESVGNSIVAIKDADIVKIHIHTNVPEDVFNRVSPYGEFINKKQEDMSLQHSELVFKKQKIKKKNVFIAVCQGEGFKELFEEAGCDIVIPGGQSMNVSVEAFVDAFNLFDAENIFVFPDNKNIILAARQAKRIYGSEKIHILETFSVFEGYFALSMKSDDDESLARQLELLESGIKGVITIEATKATKDSVINGINCDKGDYISILNNKLVASNNDLEDSISSAIRKIENLDEKSLVIVSKGKYISDDLFEDVMDKVYSKCDGLEIVVIEGLQEVYDVIIGIS